MLDLLLTIPLVVRCLAIFALGLWLGGLVNWGIYTLAFNARPISPWSKKHEKAPPRQWSDCLPVIGWLGLRREVPLWGKGFWLRPLLIEMGTAVGLALLYWWEARQELIAAPVILPLLSLDVVTHARFLSHGLLILLLIVATFIDFDEKTIPEQITDPGTILGFGLAALWPFTLPTSLDYGLPPAMLTTLNYLWVTAPNAWPAWLNGGLGLAVGWFCYWGWCFGILEKRWNLRRGFKQALRWYFGSMVAPRSNWRFVLAMAIVGPPLVAWCWSTNGDAWKGLLSSLVGAAAGGSLLWAIRIIGRQSLGKEAMGFGDVTLMAMIGAFVGWQGALIAFFIAPFAALGIALAQWVLTGRKDVAFGPYLCAGAVCVLLKWPELWEPPFGLRYHFALGPLIPIVVVVCLGLMWVLLRLMRLMRESLLKEEG